MRLSWGGNHEYPGTGLEFGGKVEVKIVMLGYLKGIINVFPGKIMKTTASSVSEHLFDVRE